MIGMNPGPFGMAQTGVPFGEVAAVKDFILMPSDIEIGKPPKENKARPINGLSCHRSEVSGRRLWLEWAREDYETADKFFETFFVHNYCPLLFLEASGKNRTPVQLKAAEREAVIKICDDGLRSVVKALKPKAICGIGGFAVKRCQQALKNEIEEEGLIIGTVLHPSPASPAANRGWVEKARIQIGEILEQVAAGEANVNGK